MKKNGVFTQNDGSKVARFGDGYVGIKFGYCNCEKLIAIANTKNVDFQAMKPMMLTRLRFTSHLKTTPQSSG